jgi:hypothetical protein
MGRYYYGTISGKFWFGIQSSYDAENFKQQLLPNEGIEYYIYYVCGCDVEDNTLNYCHDCFSDYEDHINGMDDIDKNSLEISNEYLPLLAFKNNHVKYNFDNSDLEYIKKQLFELENIIENIIFNNILSLSDDVITQSTSGGIIEKLEYKINEENDFEYYINNNIINSINNDNLLKLIARWCFGKQIECAINLNNYCYIDCEL